MKKEPPMDYSRRIHLSRLTLRFSQDKVEVKSTQGNLTFEQC